jgi:hypothetical protein
MQEQQEQKPKIIVDDDWKERVQAEKEALQKQATESRAGDTRGDKESPEDAPREPIPPASFPLLITTLVTQALAELGQVPDPSTGKPHLRAELAKHHIDMLGVLGKRRLGIYRPRNPECWPQRFMTCGCYMSPS